MQIRDTWYGISWGHKRASRGLITPEPLHSAHALERADPLDKRLRQRTQKRFLGGRPCAGIPRSVAMKISGHKTEAVYRRYAIVSEQVIADADARLEEASHKRHSRTATVRRREADAKLLSS
jgi:hypothetical protein